MTTRTMNEEIAAQLRQPFKPAEVGKLPRVTCYNCREAKSKNCSDHQKSKCRDCGNYITTAHMHLDYVGHAEITDRLLQVDAEWTWEPVASDASGLPLFDADGGLWIRLTVAGVTRLGYGDAEGKRGPSAKKETIGDALRNAAMRFGVGLDLWGAKFEPTEQEERPTTTQAAAPSTTPATSQPPPTASAGPSARARQLMDIVLESTTKDELGSVWRDMAASAKGEEITVAEHDRLIAAWNTRKDQLFPPPATQKMHAHMHVLWGQSGLGADREERIRYTGEIIGRAIASSTELTTADYPLVIKKLQAFVDQLEPAGAGAR